MSKVAFKRTDVLKVPVNAITVEEGFNVREDLGDIPALAKSLASLGQKVPLKGVKQGDTILLTAGHRRLAAAKYANEKLGANIETLLVLTERLDEKARVMEMLLDGDGSKPLSNKEMVKGIQRLLEQGVKPKEIAESLAMSKSQAQVYNLIKVTKAPTPVIKMIEEGLISVAAVNKLQRETDTEEELLEQAEQAVADAKEKGKKKATGGNTKKKKLSDVDKLEEAIKLSDPTAPKVATLQAIVNKLKKGADAEAIAKLLK